MISFFIFQSLLSLNIVAKNVEFEVSSEGKPLKNVSVLLLSLDQDPQQIAEKKTNTRGRVSFSLPEPAPQQLVGTAAYKELSFFSQRILSNNIKDKAYPIVVYEPTEDSSALQLENLQLSVTEANDYLQIEESFRLLNPTKKTVVGTASNANQKEKKVFYLSIPKNAFNIRYGFGFQQSNVQLEDNKLFVTRPIFPGESYFSLRYSLDRVRISHELRRKFSLPIEKVELALGKDSYKIKNPLFQPVGKKIFDNQTFHLFHKQNFNSDTFVLKIAGLPWNIPLSWWVPFLGLFLLFLLGWILEREGKPIKSDKEHQKTKERLLEKWRDIHKLKKMGVLSENEFLQRKLSLLRKLRVYYNTDEGLHA